MTITCPHCRHSRDIDPMAVPADVVRVLCPRCGKRFVWPPEDPPLQPPKRKREPEKKPVPSLNMPPQARPTPKTAGFGLRFIAQLIDSLVYSALTLLIAIGFYLIISYFGGYNERALGMMGMLAVFVILVSSWLYSVFFIGYCGQTPGKMVTRIKVVRSGGGEVGFGAAIFRELVGKFISTLLFGCGYLMVLFDEKNQGLHDKIADTWVIKL